LVDSRIFWYKPGLEGRKEVRITVEIEHVLVKDSFQYFTNNTEQRYRTVITFFLRISFLEDGTYMSKFPLMFVHLHLRGVFVKFVDNLIVKPIFKLILLNCISF